MVPDDSTTNAVSTTIQCKLHVTNRLGKQLKKQSSAVSDNSWSSILPQSARARSECVRHSA